MEGGPQCLERQRKGLTPSVPLFFDGGGDWSCLITLGSQIKGPSAQLEARMLVGRVTKTSQLGL